MQESLGNNEGSEELVVLGLLLYHSSLDSYTNSFKVVWGFRVEMGLLWRVKISMIYSESFLLGFRPNRRQPNFSGQAQVTLIAFLGGKFPV